WSSDVCSSDLPAPAQGDPGTLSPIEGALSATGRHHVRRGTADAGDRPGTDEQTPHAADGRTLSGAGAHHHSADLRDHRGAAPSGGDHLPGRTVRQPGAETGRPALRHGARPHSHAGQRRGAAGRPRSTPRLPRRLTGPRRYRRSTTKTGILLHPNRGFPSNRRSTRGGCEGVLVRLPFAPRAVLLHLNRGSPASKPGFFSNRRSTRPGCEGALVRHPFRTEGGAPTPKIGRAHV